MNSRQRRVELRRCRRRCGVHDLTWAEARLYVRGRHNPVSLIWAAYMVHGDREAFAAFSELVRGGVSVGELATINGDMA